jgi:hypothetical protein
MTAEHFDQLIDTLLERRPFRPFTVEIQNGERFEVDHPRSTVVRDGFAIYLKPGNVPVYFDHESVNQVIDFLADSNTAPEA